jgi:hypothetical protein
MPRAWTFWWTAQDLNLEHAPYKSAALTIELAVPLWLVALLLSPFRVLVVRFRVFHLKCFYNIASVNGVRFRFAACPATRTLADNFALLLRFVVVPNLFK